MSQVIKNKLFNQVGGKETTWRKNTQPVNMKSYKVIV